MLSFISKALAMDLRSSSTPSPLPVESSFASSRESQRLVNGIFLLQSQGYALQSVCIEAAKSGSCGPVTVELDFPILGRFSRGCRSPSHMRQEDVKSLNWKNTNDARGQVDKVIPRRS